MNIEMGVEDLNNEAVAYLQLGNYRQAVFDLEAALERLDNRKSWDPYQAQQQLQNQHNHYQAGFNCGSIRVTSVPIAPSPPNADEACSNVFEFYRKAFQIVPDDATEQQAGYIHPICNLIVLKFNLAITYHDDGIRRNRNLHLNLALELYQEILHILQYYHISGHMLLLLAIGNNIGHIHSRLMNFEQTKEALYWVRQLAISSRHHAAAVPYHDFSFFYQTAIVFNGNDLNAAPAA